MRRNHSFFAYAAASPLLAALLCIATSGCSGEGTVVEGDPVARRKHKEDALNKMLNPTGAPAPAAKTKGKGKSASAAAKDAAVDEMYLP
jgi:hypothetical protein